MHKLLQRISELERRLSLSSTGGPTLDVFVALVRRYRAGELPPGVTRQFDELFERVEQKLDAWYLERFGRPRRIEGRERRLNALESGEHEPGRTRAISARSQDQESGPSITGR